MAIPVQLASRQVSGRSLAVLRVGIGVIGAGLIIRLWSLGWLDILYAEPTHHLRYPGLAWIPTVPAAAVPAIAVLAFTGAMMLTVGWHHRIGAAAFVLGFGWLELTEATTYLNHYWLLTYLYVLAVMAPLAACWSLESWRGHVAEDLDGTIPVGWIWLFRSQVSLVYLFAGIAKLNSAWLLEGLPLRMWLPARADLSVLGGLLDEPFTAIALSWAGLIFDLSIVFLLIAKRTRVMAWCVVVAFHLGTWLLFPSIGLFPWLMIIASMIFFDPNWPERVVSPRHLQPLPVQPISAQSGVWSPAASAVAIVWLTVQITLPLRHLMYPGDARLTGEGFRFAWNVLALEKVGAVTFRLTEPSTGQTWTEDGTDLFTPQQLRVARSEPDLIAQIGRAVAFEWERRGRTVEVRVDAFVSFNGRSEVRLIDPTIDIGALSANTPVRELVIDTNLARSP